MSSGKLKLDGMNLISGTDKVQEESDFRKLSSYLHICDPYMYSYMNNK